MTKERSNLLHHLTKVQILTIILWPLYFLNNYYMAQWEKTVIAPIRMDLLFIQPILGILTIMAIGQLVWRLIQKNRR